MDDYSVVAADISKKFKIFKSPRDRLKEALSISGRCYHKEYWALQGVSFSLKKGATMGILGVNGSGKSTLLKIVCGFLQPTHGNVRTSGRIASILELGTGFNRDFTGRNNVYLYGGVMGLSKKSIIGIMPDIEAFADIGDFFDRPLRIYSSGMFMRLAFACTIYMEPDILIIDEALAVGDIAFQHKCTDRIKKLQETGVSILFVSHNISAVKSLCQEAILLEKGRTIKEGKAEDVANYYHGLLAQNEQKKAGFSGAGQKKEKEEKPASDKTDLNNSAAHRVGTGEVFIDAVLLQDTAGNLLKSVQFNQDVSILVRMKARDKCRPAVVGCLIRDRFGIDLLGTNTAVEGLHLPEMEEGELCTIVFRMRVPLLKGSYSITVAVGYDPDRPLFYDWLDNAYVFEVFPPAHRKVVNCKLHLPINIEIYK